MKYTKQNFTDGQTLTADHLNHIEEGVSQLADHVNDAVGDIEATLDNIIDIQNNLIGGYSQ